MRSDLAFWGRGIGMVTDHRQQGEGHHHQADVPVPAVPGTGLVVIELEFGLCGLERVLNAPAPPLDGDQGRDRCAGRAPRREVGPFAVAQAARISRPRVHS